MLGFTNIVLGHDLHWFHNLPFGLGLFAFGLLALFKKPREARIRGFALRNIMLGLAPFLTIPRSLRVSVIYTGCEGHGAILVLAFVCSLGSHHVNLWCCLFRLCFLVICGRRQLSRTLLALAFLDQM